VLSRFISKICCSADPTLKRSDVHVLYVDSTGRIGPLDDPRLDSMSERHLIPLLPPPLAPGDATAALGQDQSLGLLLEIGTGCPDRRQLSLLKLGLDQQRRVWLYWPAEGAAEVGTYERLASYRRHQRVIGFYERVVAPLLRLIGVPLRISYALQGMPSRDMPKWFIKRVARVMGWREPSAGSPPAHTSKAGADGEAPTVPPMLRHAQRLAALKVARQAARAIPLRPFSKHPDQQHRIPGYGVYLRTDFWAPIVSGGSYGHTCYVAKELAAVTESFVCFTANRFPLLDESGLTQIVMPRPSETNNEDDIASAVPHYLSQLRPIFEELRPAYIYERLCLGNSAAALLSAEFAVPYIVEYNGSEISMRRSFEDSGYVYEAEYLETEALAFEQATIISVVSAEIRHTLVARGVDPAKILVNPNGVDLAAYAPAPREERESIRAGLGFDEADRVIGFTGTFGGWHGIDVLSEAIPRICQAVPSAKFLLIGDGHFKTLVDRAVTTFGLERRVRSTGRVPQVEGARLLKACDIYVSPHSAHMIDSKFFGSPTKVFEYMALGGGIVASDLEQIGQVLSPSMTPDDASAGASVTDERAVLCTPGNVGQFVQAVVALAKHPDTAGALGRNARQAAATHYSWARHVANIWMFAAGESFSSEILPDLRRKPKLRRGAGAAAAATTGSSTGTLVFERPEMMPVGDAYKDQVQRQWNNDPAGSHYVVEAPAHTKEWFLEAERHRYGSYAPWMPEVMEFDRHGGEEILEIGGGMGTDLAQFALHGARVTDLDLSSGHLTLAKENFVARGLQGRFIQQDAETLDFRDNTFDLVYSNGVLHHTPNTHHVVREILRILKPGGKAIAMFYAEDSLHYWRNLMWKIGVREGQLRKYSMGEIMSRSVERSDNAAAHPLVKAYTKTRLRRLFEGFVDLSIVQRQMEPEAVPRTLRFVPRRDLGKIMGWNLIIKARKPKS
jgi:glycosyltransferase involved in cell wall biosynthesis/ubiquinone/menaquinone biosynthesis C-methylase UbiE